MQVADPARASRARAKFERRWCTRSVSVVSRATCKATREPVVIKAYERARMKPKNYTRLGREVNIMLELGGNEGMARPRPRVAPPGERQGGRGPRASSRCPGAGRPSEPACRRRPYADAAAALASAGPCDTGMRQTQIAKVLADVLRQPRRPAAEGRGCRADAAGGPRRQVELYAVISDAEHICLVMEYCRGGDLFKELARGGGALEEAWVSAQAWPLPPARARARAARQPAPPPACTRPWPPHRNHSGFEHTLGSEHAEHGRSVVTLT